MRVTNVPAGNGQNIPGPAPAGQLGRRRFLVAGSAAAALIGSPAARSLTGALARHAGRAWPARESAANPAATGS
jgi:hypothetical protein